MYIDLATPAYVLAAILWGPVIVSIIILAIWKPWNEDMAPGIVVGSIFGNSIGAVMASLLFKEKPLKHKE